MKHIVKRPAWLDTSRPAEIEYYDHEDIGRLDQIISYIDGIDDKVKIRKRPTFATQFMTLDTETTTLPAGSRYNPGEVPLSFIYMYQIRIGGVNFIMRRREEIEAFMNYAAERCREAGARLVCYVHNLSFEFQFLKSILEINPDSIFALQNRRIAKFDVSDQIEFRCSYLLSNMSLEKFTENYCSEEYRKDKELIDYEIERFPWSELEPETIYYGLMDVITLEAGVSELMTREGDNLRTIPMTNTGYVRRSCRAACLGHNTKNYSTPENAKKYNVAKRYRHMFLKTKLSLEAYDLLCDAFRGGNTHANRFYTGQIIKRVGHADFNSSYPAQLICSAEFPMGRLMECTNSLRTIADIDWYSRRYWLILKVCFEDLALKDPYTVKCPYIPHAKIDHERGKGGIYDNGRIIRQDGYCFFTFLGIEWPIIRQQYAGSKMRVVKAYYTPKGYLPDALRKTALEWYQKKTELKGVSGMEYEYMKSKNRVNSIYGMMVEHIIKDIMDIMPDLSIKPRKPTDEEKQGQLDEFYGPRAQKFLCFQWGVTITALARAEHMRLVDLLGDDFVYGDTDSVFYTHPEKYQGALEEYNRAWQVYIEQCGLEPSATDKKGRRFVLGVADIDEVLIDRFVTLGAKKYVMETGGKLEITVAGVPKKLGAALLGRIENFKPGFVFRVGDEADLSTRQNWKKILHYHDGTDLTLQIDGHELRITSGIAITRAPYKLDITDEYRFLTGYTEIYMEDDIL